VAAKLQIVRNYIGSCMTRYLRHRLRLLVPRSQRRTSTTNPAAASTSRGLHSLRALLRRCIPSHASLFAGRFRLRNSSRKGRRGDGDNQAEGDNRYKGFHKRFLRCRLHHNSKHRKVALELPPNVTRRFAAASLCRRALCRPEAMITRPDSFPKPTLRASASVGALFIALRDGLLHRTSTILNSSCNGLLLLAYPERDVAAYQSSGGHHGHLGFCVPDNRARSFHRRRSR
jgi:hypothetical protein